LNSPHLPHSPPLRFGERVPFLSRFAGEDVKFDNPPHFPYHPRHQQGHRPVFAYL
jgi:hypothetical protein